MYTFLTYDNFMDKKFWREFIEKELYEKVEKFHTDEIESIVVETQTTFLKIIRIGKIEEAETYPEFYLCNYFFENPHKYIFRPKKIFFVINTHESTSVPIQRFAVVVMDKLFTLEECYDFFTETNKLQMCQQLEEAVNHIHSIGYYHGDLKPYNICLNREYEIQVIDFGGSNKISKTEFTNSFGYCSPSQFFKWMMTDKYKTHKRQIDILRKLIKLKIIQKKDGRVVVNECSKTSDLFVVGLMMINLYGKGIMFFDPDVKESGPDDTEFFNRVIANYQTFLNEPVEYIKKVFKKIHPPKIIRDKIWRYLLKGVFRSNG